MPAYHEPVYGKLTLASLSRAIRRGWEMFLRTRPLSVSFAMIFAVVGVIILVSIARASFAPMIFPLAGGFMLIGPFLLTGFFAIADRIASGDASSFSDIVRAF